MCVKKTNSITVRLTQVRLRRKTGPTLLTVAKTAPVFFLVAIRSARRRIQQRRFPTPNPGACLGPAGHALPFAHFNSPYDYEESAQTSGGAAAAAHSWADAADGEGARHTVVSRCVSAAATDRPGVAVGGERSGAQTRTRRFLNLELQSSQHAPNRFTEPRAGKQPIVETCESS